MHDRYERSRERRPRRRDARAAMEHVGVAQALAASTPVRSGGSNRSGTAHVMYVDMLGSSDERSARAMTMAEVGRDGEQRAGARIGELASWRAGWGSACSSGGKRCEPLGSVPRRGPGLGCILRER